MPLGIAVAGANRHDVTVVEATVASIPIDRPAADPTLVYEYTPYTRYRTR